MYTRGMLERYAETIDSPAERTQFQTLVGVIEYNGLGGTRQLCPASALSQAMDDSPVAHLAQDFRERFIEFLTEDDI
jgi:hypothetical protein